MLGSSTTVCQWRSDAAENRSRTVVPPQNEQENADFPGEIGPEWDFCSRGEWWRRQALARCWSVQQRGRSSRPQTHRRKCHCPVSSIPGEPALIASQKLPLLLPACRQRPFQPLQYDPLIRPAAEDRRDNIGCKERKPAVSVVTVPELVFFN